MPRNAQGGEEQLPGEYQCTNVERENETDLKEPGVRRPVFEFWLQHLQGLCGFGQIRIGKLTFQGCCKKGEREDMCENAW